MKALTILQPFATLITRGEKRVENRTWETRYRGKLLIHAGKSREMLQRGADPSLHIFGSVLAVARVVDCLPFDQIERGVHDRKYPWLRTHDHTFGPWCWILADVKPLTKPLPYTGRQGLFNIPWEEEA